MPLSLNNPKTFTLDKVIIDKFEVTPEGSFVTIHFSKGYENELGQFIPVEYSRVDFNAVNFETSLYEAVKNKLYQLLTEHINSPVQP